MGDVKPWIRDVSLNTGVGQGKGRPQNPSRCILITFPRIHMPELTGAPWTSPKQNPAIFQPRYRKNKLLFIAKPPLTYPLYDTWFIFVCTPRIFAR